MTKMRLQRALARAGVASRRAAERLIEDGRVRVDGQPATLGMKVDPERQRITVGNRPVKLKQRRWLAFHKPLGVVTTARDEEGRRAVEADRPVLHAYRLAVRRVGVVALYDLDDGDAPLVVPAHKQIDAAADQRDGKQHPEPDAKDLKRH